jgi:hypothetical protein
MNSVGDVAESDFDIEEILSMGQGSLESPEDWPASLYLVGPLSRSPEGMLFRDLARFYVLGKLGLEIAWPGDCP